MRKRYLAFEIQRMLAMPYFETSTGAGQRGSGGGGSSGSDFEDGDPRPGNDSQSIYHDQEAADAAADAGGGIARYSPDDGYWVVSYSESAQAQNNLEAGQETAEAYLGISEDLAAMQIEIAATQTAIMEEQWDRYLSIYGPVEEEWVAAAQAGLPADYYVNRAAADVEQSFAQADEAQKRELASYGIDPSSARYAGMQEAQDVQKSAAKAGAMTNTRFAINDANYQRQSDVVKTGRGIPTEAASIGSSASNSLSAAGNQYASGYGGLTQAYNELGNYYATVDAQNKANAAASGASTMGAIGTGVGAVVGGIYGGPMGAAAGASAGNSVGTAIG